MVYSKAEEKVQISHKSQKILNLLLEENPRLKEILYNAKDDLEVNSTIKKWALTELKENPIAFQYYNGESVGRKTYEKIKWQEIAAIRILDYIEHTDQVYIDLNVRGQKRTNTPFKILWLAVKDGTGGGKHLFFVDMLHLFRQFSGQKTHKVPSCEQIQEWMDKHPSGLDEDIVETRKKE